MQIQMTVDLVHERVSEALRETILLSIFKIWFPDAFLTPSLLYTMDDSTY